MRGVGFEPTKALSQQVLSLSRLVQNLVLVNQNQRFCLATPAPPQCKDAKSASHLKNYLKNHRELNTIEHIQQYHNKVLQY